MLEPNKPALPDLHEKAPIRAIIVDDEKEACMNLQYLLKECDPFIRIEGVAHNTQDAEKLIRQVHPQVVFLDIEMPREDAFSFLDRIAPVDFEVIFVTAYNEFAVKAFKLNAVDYILKPVNTEELSNAVKKLRAGISYKNAYLKELNTYSKMNEDIKNRVSADKIVLKDSNDVDVVSFMNLVYIEAKGSYSQIHYLQGQKEKNKYMSRPIAEYEELLPGEMFYRIHKSYLLNVHHIQKIVKDESPYAIISGKYHLPVSRRKFTEFLSFLKGIRVFPNV